MSISVTVTLTDVVQVDVSTDAGFSADILSDLLARARGTALLAGDGLDVEP